MGLDVSKKIIAVAIAEEGREEPRYFDTLAPWGLAHFNDFGSDP
jgi:hypothetical protein